MAMAPYTRVREGKDRRRKGQAQSCTSEQEDSSV